jgi:hypothetical protein
MKRWYVLFLLFFFSSVFSQQAFFIPNKEYPVDGKTTCVKVAPFVNQPDGIAALSIDSNTIALFSNDGNGKFQLADTYSFGFRPMDMVVEPVDGSNITQFVIVGQTADTNGVVPDSLVIFKYFSSSAPEKKHFGHVHFPIKITSFTINSDELPDVAIANYIGNGYISVFVGDMTQGLVFTDSIPVGEYPVDLIGLDVNHQGSLDLVVLNWKSKDIHVLVNTGNGTFQPFDTLALGYTPIAFTPFYLSGIQSTGIAVLGASPDTVEILQVTQTGSLVHYSGFSLPALSSRIIGKDVDFDGDEDIIIAVKTLNRVDVYLNDQNANFSFHSSTSTGLFPTDIAIGDFDEDLLPDLVTANYYGHSFSTLLYYQSPVGIDEPSESHPIKHFDLLQNYPNPFNPVTQIPFRLKEPSFITLTLYSVTGRKIATLINNQHYNAGLYKYTLQAQDLPSGIYFYQLEVNRQTQIRKMILLK